MFGVFVFQNILFNLGEKCRNKVLGNIFGVDNVSVSDLVIREDKVIFRLFGGDVFYQYIFDFSDNVHDSSIKVSCSRDIVNSFVVVSEYFRTCSFDLLVEIFKCQDEHRIYQLMKLFL